MYCPVLFFKTYFFVPLSIRYMHIDFCININIFRRIHIHNDKKLCSLNYFACLSKIKHEEICIFVCLLKYLNWCVCVCMCDICEKFMEITSMNRKNTLKIPVQTMHFLNWHFCNQLNLSLLSQDAFFHFLFKKLKTTFRLS